MEMMKIVKYKPEYQKQFEQLNKSWVEKYFKIEPMDETILYNPDEFIIKNGGKIFFVEYQSKIIGTVALIYVSDGVFELAKMAVNESFQGLGAGKLLCKTAIDEAKKMKATKLILFTNSKLKPAISIYHKLGFKNVQLDGQEYKRADTKMELVITNKWFDRDFNFDFGIEQYDNLLDRLENFPMILNQKLDQIPEQFPTYNTEGKWSINQNIGHLFLLEIIWRARFQEINDGKKMMSPADLNNTATTRSSFNKLSITELTKCFWYERIKTIDFLKSLNSDDILKSSIHPRLNQPMRVIDLMYFVAEHDQHHMNTILEIMNNKFFTKYEKGNTIR